MPNIIKIIQMKLNFFEKIPFQKRGWICLFSCFLLHFVLGVFYLWGSIVTYIGSYISHEGENISVSTLGLVFPFLFLAINIGNPFGVILAKKIGFRIYILVGTILIGVTIIISSFIIHIFPVFVLFYGVIFGLLVGLLYMPPFSTIYMYFPHRKGFVSGVITAGLGLSSSVYIWLIYSIINPNNHKPDTIINEEKHFSKEIVQELPKALRILAACQIALGCLSALLHIRPTLEEAQEFEKKLKANMMKKIKENNQQQNFVNENEKVNEEEKDNNNDKNIVSLEKDQQNNDQNEQLPIEPIAIPQNDKISESESNKQNDQSDTNKIQHAIDLSSHQNSKQSSKSNSLQNHSSKKDAGGQLEQSKTAFEADNNNNQLGVQGNEVYLEFPTFTDGIRTKFIYISALLTMLFSIFGAMIVSQFKNYGESLGYDDIFNSWVGTFGSILNGAARIIWGYLMEKVVFKKLVFANVTIQIIISLTFGWIQDISALFVIWTLLSFFLFGAWFAMMPSLINRIYGRVIGSQIYAVTFFGFSLAAIIQFVFISQVKPKIGWQATFWIFTFMQAMGILLSVFIKFNAKPTNQMKLTQMMLRLSKQGVKDEPIQLKEQEQQQF